MKLYDYIPEALLMQRIEEGYVNVNNHKKFPLAIYTYSKSATFDYVWDEATCKCRGLIVDLTTMEILARPMQKFFNVGEKGGEAQWAGLNREEFPQWTPTITDKLDGNLITLYPWKGHWYAASKGSFHSEHADWANEWLTTNVPNQNWPVGYTPVFEMIAEELEHHVVHYGKEASGLYLITIIHNETGEELNYATNNAWAEANDIPCIPENVVTLTEALAQDEKNAEGYVVSWGRICAPPIRVKIKFPDFLRLQRLVHNIGPKEILDYLRKPELKCYLDEVLDPERSHPEFIKYVQAWMSRFSVAYNNVVTTCDIEMNGILKFLSVGNSRKDWAALILRTQYPSVLFAVLDAWTGLGSPDRVKQIIWKHLDHVAEQPDDIRSLITQEE